MKNQISIVQQQVSRLSWWRLLRQRAAHQLRAHPYRYMLRLIFIIALLAFMTVQVVRGASIHPLLVMGANLYLLLVLFGLTQPVNAKAEELHDWAMEEQEHLSVSSLTGTNEEELETLLQYHMKHGHLEEADRISQKLLAVVEGGPQALADLRPQTPADADALASAAVPASPKAAQPPSDQGFPDWMQEGAARAPEKKEEETEDTTALPPKKLPDWLN